MKQLALFKVDKLLRDKIPEIMEAERGTSLEYSVLEDKQYIVSLKNKLIEEAIEVQNTTGIEEFIDEVADVMEVIDALLDIHGITIEEIRYTQQKHKDNRGGFKKRIFGHTVSVLEENHKRLEYYRKKPDKYPEINISGEVIE